ncbi:MAG: hypoxanthine phosphoribosyltransferase [Saprospiraceae bacterium]|nr:hypoxanthine phosphoribosyltransferase [Saprospiraceae bacterium]
MKETKVVGDLKFTPYIKEGKVLHRVGELADEIKKDYEGKCPVFLVVLNGAFRFASDLARGVEIESEWQFVKLSSYEGMESSGSVRVIESLTIDLKGRHVIVVEDIVDTGTSMEYYLEQLKDKEVASIRLASLLVKEEALQHEIIIHYLGFSIPDRFVVGYGLDYNELGRNLNGIWQLDV